MVERDLAKGEVASSTLVSRSKISKATQGFNAGVALIFSLRRDLVGPLQSRDESLSPAAGIEPIEIGVTVSHADLPLLRRPPIYAGVPCRKLAALQYLVIQIHVSDATDQLNCAPARLRRDRCDTAVSFVVGASVVGQEIADSDI